MLAAKVDELVAMTSRDLDEIRAVTDQLEPDRSQSCRVVLTMARVVLTMARVVLTMARVVLTMVRVMLDEVRLRPHARPLDEPVD